MGQTITEENGRWIYNELGEVLAVFFTKADAYSFAHQRKDAMIERMFEGVSYDW